jgi:spermidine/putrescine-binding protein
MRVTRRTFLGTAGAALLAGCGQRSGTGPHAGEELRVFCYAGGHEAAMREVFVPAFEGATGAAVTLYPGWWGAPAKVKLAPPDDPPYDLMVSDATEGFPAARDGLFARLDLDNIPNHRNLVPAALDHWVYQERYGITYPDSVMTFGFNRKRAGAEPARWVDLLRPDLAGKLGLYEHYYMSLYTFACARADAEGKPGTAHNLLRTDLGGCLRFARDHRDRVKVWWKTSTDMILALTNGDVAAGNLHSPEYIPALREKPDLGAAVPPTDRAFVQVFWAVPAGSPRKGLAETAIDLIFSDEVQLGFARKGSATAVPAVAARMAAEDPFWKRLYPHTPEQFAGLKYYPYDLYAEHGRAIADEWDRTVLRDG